MSDKTSNTRGKQGLKKLVSRLLAVQAIYELSQNGKNLDLILKDYLSSRIGMQYGPFTIENPDEALFLKITKNVTKNSENIQELVNKNFVKSEDQEQPSKIEPLLNSILFCGIAELIEHQDIDHPIIINDYLDVTGAFYEKSEIALVNALFDSIARVLRT